MIFLLGAYAAALPQGAKLSPKHFGLALGGLFEAAPLRGKRVLQESMRALLVASLVCVVILPFFWIGFPLFHQPESPWDFSRVLQNENAFFLPDLALSHLLMVALPEEAFFRGYLQTALDDRYKARIQILGTRWGVSILLVSVIFALGHLATTGYWGRLAVFFPSLLFGILRVRTGGIGASIVLHAQFNVAAAVLGRGYGLF